ncbi:peptidoglycan recognition family protein [Variovorax sp. J2P1-59]|uniref:peptidoglycan recognition protein family protein n=1 Tax=Variovorax flavidus TaxID=3053501 RepID=UPI002575C886|nr:peptidoglycan recognition family protein [Variovorax sp. J2P1-59]MDM0078042.1 peptidoglycan recognition family protein [Variovorax sp. J2P1-59]
MKIFSTIERRQLDKINGIVVHQTASPTAQSAFNSYSNAGANGAHFLIDKDGTIYQTASLYKTTNHVGLLQSRCIVTKRCSPSELKAASSIRNAKLLTRHESKKAFPDRFPMNEDSIGIEIVSAAPKKDGKEIFDAATEAQNGALKWLVKELAETLGVSMQETYRHPEIGRKNPTEASTAKW